MKKYITILLIIVMALSITACQETPEEVIVVKKDMERMIEQAQTMPDTSENGQSLKDKTHADNSVSYELSEDNVSIKVDAPVTIPGGTQMSIVRVTPGDFTQEQVSAIWNTLIVNTEMFSTSDEMTKSEIESAIISAKEFIAKAENEEAKARYNAQLSFFESIYNAAPEQREAVKADGTLGTLYMRSYGSSDKTEYIGFQAQDESGAVHFVVSNSYEDETGYHDATLSYTRGMSGFSGDGAPTIERYDLEITDDSVPEQAAELGSPQSAAEQVQVFFNNTNIPFDIAFATLNYDGSSWYYLFHCTRVIGDIPSAFIMGESYYEGGSAEYAKTWTHETLTISIDSAGIRNLQWEAPVEITESVVENSSLIAFSDVQKIFDEMMMVTYGFQAHEAESLAIEVSDIRLEMLRIIEPNAADSGLLVPAWNFYGTRTIKYIDGAENATSSNMILLSVNAIDGTIIDLSKGY